MFDKVSAQRVPIKNNTLDVNTLRRLCFKNVGIESSYKNSPRKGAPLKILSASIININRGIKSSYKTKPVTLQLLFASIFKVIKS